MTLTHIYYLHEIGSKKNQEDYLWPVPGTASPDDRIFIVCDGVGGSENGEVASRIVSESVGTSLLKAGSADVGVPLINRLLEDARQKLVDYASLHSLNTDMATTFTLLWINEKSAFVAWCGDSRVYQIRSGQILYRTEDHSLVSSLVRSGELTEAEAREHPQKNLLLKAVKADDTTAEAEGGWIEDIRDGDYFMLCTDGLMENTGERELLFLLQQNDRGDIDLLKSFQQFCYDKTKDNYSMYLIRIGLEQKEIAGTRTAKRARHRARTIGWVLLLLLLTGAAAFIIKENYFSKKKVIYDVVPVNHMADTTAIKDTVAEKDTVVKADTVVAGAVKVHPAADSGKIRSKDTNSSHKH